MFKPLQFLLDLFKTWWGRVCVFVAVATYCTSFFPTFVIPRWFMIVISAVAWVLAPYDVYRRQQEEIETFKPKPSAKEQLEEIELKDKLDQQELAVLAERIWEWASESKRSYRVTTMSVTESQLAQHFKVTEQRARQAAMLLKSQERAQQTLPSVWIL